VRDRVTIPQAAERLGISESAVRKRISRRQIDHDRESGRVFVYLDTEPDQSRTEADNVPDTVTQRLLDAREEISYLRGQLDAERAAHAETREARRRADHIIAALTERIPELEASPQTAQGAESMAESASGGESGEEAWETRTGPQSMDARERVSWWRRLFGR
jgi:predicted ArsR family transcriptional regulator